MVPALVTCWPNSLTNSLTTAFCRNFFKLGKLSSVALISRDWGKVFPSNLISRLSGGMHPKEMALSKRKCLLNVYYFQDASTFFGKIVLLIAPVEVWDHFLAEGVASPLDHVERTVLDLIQGPVKVAALIGLRLVKGSVIAQKSVGEDIICHGWWKSKI